MRIAISTLGCPHWTLDDVLRQWPAFGADAVDFRGLAEGLDITLLPDFTSGLAATARRIADAGLVVTAISSGIKICDPEAREANLEEARRTIPVALALGAPFVRVFGAGPAVEDGARASRAADGAATLDAIARLPGAESLRWLLETHDHWIARRDVHAVLDGVAAPNVGVLWDVAHTLRYVDETYAETIAAYGARIGNVHIKDAVREGDGWRYVAVGEGELPLTEAMDALFATGYDGPLTLEHEKRWHPELSTPETAFPPFVAWARRWKKA